MTERLRPFHLLVLEVAVLSAAAALGFAALRAGGVWLEDGRLLGLFMLAVAVVYGFTAAVASLVAWTQFTATEVAASKEAALLGDVYDASARLSDREEAQGVAAGIRRYVETVLADEWRRLADGRSDPAAQELFLDLSSRLCALAPRDPADERAVAIIQDRVGPWADLRKKRVSWGLTRMPRPMWWLLCLQAWTTVAVLALYPGRDFATQLACVAAAAALMGWSQLMIRDLDNPFDGFWNVSPAAFEELNERLSLRLQPRK